MDSLTFLDSPPKGDPLPLYVLHGDEDFLKAEVLKALRTRVFTGEGDEFGQSTHAGDKATFAAVFDDLQTLSFFGGRRLVVVDNADSFVTRNRAVLEKTVGKMPPTGVLVLNVQSWPSNTRLYKLVDPASAIACKAPAAHRLPPWCTQWAKSRHGKQLTAQAAQLLVELVGPEMGQLDQELQKLAVYVGTRSRIDAEDVDRLVGRSRAENTFKIFDAIAEGRPSEALRIVERLFEQGEEPMRILGAFSYQLKRLAQAARLNQQGVPLTAALEQTGVAPYAVKGCEQQMKHLGRRRLNRLYDWLLEIDQGLKGGSPLPPQTLFERLIVRLARKLT
jgi:DNA polymerase-3 subunit delta